MTLRWHHPSVRSGPQQSSRVTSTPARTPDLNLHCHRAQVGRAQVDTPVHIGQQNCLLWSGERSRKLPRLNVPYRSGNGQRMEKFLPIEGEGVVQFGLRPDRPILKLTLPERGLNVRRKCCQCRASEDALPHPPFPTSAPESAQLHPSSVHGNAVAETCGARIFVGADP